MHSSIQQQSLDCKENSTPDHYENGELLFETIFYSGNGYGLYLAGEILLGIDEITWELFIESLTI